MLNENSTPEEFIALFDLAIQRSTIDAHEENPNVVKLTKEAALWHEMWESRRPWLDSGFEFSRRIGPIEICISSKGEGPSCQVKRSGSADEESFVLLRFWQEGAASLTGELAGWFFDFTSWPGGGEIRLGQSGEGLWDWRFEFGGPEC
jgi:hypothetical protein